MLGSFRDVSTGGAVLIALGIVAVAGDKGDVNPFEPREVVARFFVNCFVPKPVNCEEDHPRRWHVMDSAQPFSIAGLSAGDCHIVYIEDP